LEAETDADTCPIDRQDVRLGHQPPRRQLGADLKQPEATGGNRIVLTYLRDEARKRFDAGMSAETAADDIDVSDFRGWGDPERIAVNVATLYREFDPSLPELTVPELFVRMARWAARH
jgi:hypothetical protein